MSRADEAVTSWRCVCVCVWSNVQVYSVGSEEELELAVAVENRGEDAFESTVRIFTPPDVDYVSVGDIAAPVSSPSVVVTSN